MLKIYLTFFLGVVLSTNLLFAQSVLDPSDPIVNYNSSAPPTQPAYGQIGKWVRTPRLSWNTSEYKCYIYKGCAFRLLFPKSYNATATDGKKYPMLVFFHGLGETGNIYDNEYSLFHGGDVFNAAVDNGNFDGYVLIMQSQGFWGGNQYTYITEIIDYMVANNKLDGFEVSDNGLSAGGQGSWEMMMNYPNYIASSIPMSHVDISYKNSSVVNEVKFTPIWDIQGGLDGAPAPSTAQQVRDAMVAAGGDYRYTEYPNLGHNTWDQTWTEPDFYPFMLRAYSSNPWPLNGKSSFCPNETINVTMGIPPGFDQYQWKAGNTIIDTASHNQITVNQAGTYYARVLRGSVWSDWSHTPVVVSVKSPTVTPPIQVSGLMSTVIPAVDGKTYVNLTVPNSYTSYTWKKVGSDSIVGTQKIYKAAQPGYYVVSVTEQFGCSSNYSPAFKVINANGPNPPSAAKTLIATSVSNTQIQLNWQKNPSPVNPQTAFEIYRGQTAGGPYTFIGQVAKDTINFIDSYLIPNTKYFYVVRAIDSTAAAALSNEANATTFSDKIAPSIPNNLRSVYTSPTTITIAWSPSTDNVSVDHYAIYVNGQLSNVTKDTTFIITGLTEGQSYGIYVKAVDGSNNYSPQSAQLNAGAILGGLRYKYYTSAAGWQVLPDFSALTPASTGISQNTDISVATQSTNFGFVWQGYLRVPVDGTYTIQTSSDDGSALWFNSYTPTGARFVNNDGLHGTVSAGNTITLKAGVYPICAEFFQLSGGASMSLSWSCTALYGDNSQHTITNNYFVDAYTPSGNSPAQPTNVTATANSYNTITLSWNDNSNNESGFEIYRANSMYGPFSIINTSGANSVSFKDSGLTAATKYFYKVQAINKYGVSGFDPGSISGITYNFYQGSFSNTVALNSSAPVATGIINNISLSPATVTSNFGFKYAGAIHVPASGQYTFYTASDDGSDLYIGGFDSSHLIVKNDYAQGITERSGSVSLTAGVYYPFYVTYYQGAGGYGLSASWQGPNIAKAAIPDSVFLNNKSSATTLAAPALPAAPTAVKAQVNSSSKITVTWTENDPSVSSLNLYTSINDNMHFQLLASLPAGTVKYADTALFGNKIYYFKLTAVAPQGNSASSAVVSGTTKNDIPVITDIPNTYIRYGTVSTINVNTIDIDGDSISYTVKNKPAFATLTDNKNNTATLSFNPKSTQQGTYSMSVVANDGHGGKDTTTFSVIVNSNYTPTIDSVINYTMDENGSLNIPLSAHDQNTTDILTWSFTGLPASFATLVNGSNGNASISLHPGYKAANTYAVQVTVTDGNGGTATRQFTLVVNDVDPNTKIYVRFLSQNQIGTPWNSVSQMTTTNFTDALNRPTTVGLAIQGTWYNTFNAGPTTGNNSGIYPDAVLQDYFYSGVYGGPDPETMKLTGLDPSKFYNLSFFGSSIWPGAANNGTTIYTVGTQSDTLAVQGNTQNTVSINSIKPAVDGTITFTISKGPNTPASYLNALVITSLYDDGTKPVVPNNLTAQNVAGGVQLSWQDVAYNETGYNIYRSLTKTGTYTLVGQAITDAVSYTDTSVNGNTQYYYKVNCYNSYGTSAYTSIAGILTGDRVPKLTAVNDVILKNNAQATINIKATDDAADHVTLSASGLPSFAAFTDNGNGTGKIIITPASSTIGTYPVTVTATDNSDSSSSTSFNIIVTDQNITSVYLNFSDGINVGSKPWNNLSGYPFSGTTFSGIKDDGNSNSGITVQFPNGFQGIVNSGMQPVEGNGIYPNSVMRSAEFEGSAKTDTIKISGLSASKKYNFVFFNSHDDGLNGLTNFTIGSQTVSSNATDNISKTVQINGISADANGNVIIKIAKGSGADYAFISSLIIQSYDPAVTTLAPTNLRVINATRSAISLQWEDRSTGESGFEIWRATDSAGTYSLLAALPAGSTSYTNTGLSSNTTYYYTVRAVYGSNYSNYSGAVSGTTYSYSVYVNCTTNNDAGIPWNNTDAIPQSGYTWNNYFDETGVTTSTGMQLTSTWAGDYTAGMNPGDNSGIFPDSVMIDSYGLFPGQTGMLQISGLNLGMKYDFTFYGSSQAYGDVNGAYTINGVTAILNASLNINGTVTIYGVVPDANGNVNISVSAASLTSQFGLLNALIIKGYTPSSAATVPQPLQPSGFTNPLARNAHKQNDKAKATTSVTPTVKAVSAYPNPFHNYFTLSVPGENNNDAVQVMMFDISGRIVYSNVFSTHTGINFLQIQTNAGLTPGMYELKVINSNTKSSTTIKLIKQ